MNVSESAVSTRTATAAPRTTTHEPTDTPAIAVAVTPDRDDAGVPTTHWNRGLATARHKG
jgi:hypothetical protein